MRLLILLAVVGLGRAFAQTPSPKSDLPTLAPDDDGWTDEKIYSAAEKKAACNKYNQKVVAYYDRLYRIEHCKYREIQSAGDIFRLNSLNTKIIPVDGEVFAMLKAGPPILDADSPQKKARDCKSLNQRYVTFTYTDVYYVEGCRKRLFPDWVSFIEHQKKKLGRVGPIEGLTWEEYRPLKEGEPMPSMLDENYQAQSIVAKNVDVIPQNVACRGLNGKDVSYVDRLYRIENCRKRAYDSTKYFQTHKDVKLRELTSEQWLSLPEGKPM